MNFIGVVSLCRRPLLVISLVIAAHISHQAEDHRPDWRVPE